MLCMRRHTLPDPHVAFWLLACVLLLAPGCAPGQHGDHDAGHAPGEAASGAAGPEAPADPEEEIRQWQEARDASARDSVMTPFTAVQAYYLDEGVPARLGAGEERTALNPEPALPAMAEITYEEEAFWVAPVEGSRPPFVHLPDEQGEPLAGGTEIEERHLVGDDEIIAVGRYFLSMSPQSGLGRVIVYDPESPRQKEFHGFRWFPAAPDMRVKAAWVPFDDPQEVAIATSRGLQKTFFRSGRFEFQVDGTPQTLVGLTAGAEPEEGERIFTPFRDATTGDETYEAGRYLHVRYQGQGAEHTIDFNRATNPFCNYSVHYNCPLPPEENRLTVAIKAGEMTYPDHGS